MNLNEITAIFRKKFGNSHRFGVEAGRLVIWTGEKTVDSNICNWAMAMVPGSEVVLRNGEAVILTKYEVQLVEE
jgi:hypothetical protein